MGVPLIQGRSLCWCFHTPVSTQMKSSKLMAVAGMTMVMTALTSCNGLSDYEKTLVGSYYNTALSDMKPAIELRADRSATVRAIRPGDLTYSVSATWKATGDSLILVPDASSIVVEEGDPMAVGNVAPRLSWPIVKCNEQTLTLVRDRNTIDYKRRYE